MASPPSTARARGAHTAQPPSPAGQAGALPSEAVSGAGERQPASRGRLLLSLEPGFWFPLRTEVHGVGLLTCHPHRSSPPTGGDCQGTRHLRSRAAALGPPSRPRRAAEAVGRTCAPAGCLAFAVGSVPSVPSARSWCAWERGCRLEPAGASSPPAPAVPAGRACPHALLLQGPLSAPHAWATGTQPTVHQSDGAQWVPASFSAEGHLSVGVSSLVTDKRDAVVFPETLRNRFSLQISHVAAVTPATWDKVGVRIHLCCA